jgi:hypothetical protein
MTRRLSGLGLGSVLLLSCGAGAKPAGDLSPTQPSSKADAPVEHDNVRCHALQTQTELELVAWEPDAVVYGGSSSSGSPKRAVSF